MKNTATLLLLFLFFSSGVHAQCISGDCYSGYGIMLYEGGEKYVGDFSRAKRHGYGEYSYNDGSKYIGYWRRGKRHGQGKMTFANGKSEQGRWHKGHFKTANTPNTLTAKGNTPPSRPTIKYGCVSGDCQDGQGTYVYPGGAIYVGTFQQGEIHGSGICYYPDGSIYKGQWVHRYPEGFGTKTYSNKKKRTGKWLKGQAVDDENHPISQGDLEREIDQEAVVLQSGCLRGDCANGRGIFAYPDGSRYEGDFQDNYPEGTGVFYYPNGDQYMGEFTKGLQNGKGKLRYADGKVKSGQWREGEFLSTQSVPTKGCIKGNCQSGFGTYIFKDDALYEGAFKNGLPEGKGIVKYKNGERYEGHFKQGAFNGFGTLITADGQKYSGNWNNGNFAGAVATIPAQSPKTSPKIKVWALIIGVASYNHMPTLHFTDDDAYRMYAFLKSPEGGALPDEQISILIDEDATKHKIIQQLEQLSTNAGPNDLILLYFSGHGIKGAFLPIDFVNGKRQLKHTEIAAILDKSKAKNKLVIADACHSGSWLTPKGGKKPLLEKYYETLATSRPGTALIMSSKSEETSLESSGLRQGVFTHFLIRGMKGEADDNADSLVSVQELFRFVSKGVREYTGNRQSPIIKGNYDKKMPVGIKY